MCFADVWLARGMHGRRTARSVGSTATMEVCLSTRRSRTRRRSGGQPRRLPPTSGSRRDGQLVPDAGQMPEPDMTLGRTHVWRPSKIIAWHEARPRPGVGGRPGHDNDNAAGEDDDSTELSPAKAGLILQKACATAGLDPARCATVAGRLECCLSPDSSRGGPYIAEWRLCRPGAASRRCRPVAGVGRLSRGPSGRRRPARHR